MNSSFSSSSRSHVVECNREISFNANRKKISAALSLFEKLKSSGTANSHSYAAMLNAYIRCGKVNEAETLFNELLTCKTSSLKADVIHYTTMIKGLCSIYNTEYALQLFNQMLNNKSIHPNIRTFNTLMRGMVTTGSVDEAIDVFKRTTNLNLAFDSSSYESYINLLCQSLRVDLVYPMIGRLKSESRFQSGLSVMYYYIARASALLGNWKKVRRFAKEALRSINYGLTEPPDNEIAVDVNVGIEVAKPVIGGKRAWKEIDESRLESLRYYQVHKNDELKRDIEILQQFMMLNSKMSGKQVCCEVMRSYIMVLLFPRQSNQALTKSDLIKSFSELLSISFGVNNVFSVANCTQFLQQFQSSLGQPFTTSITSATEFIQEVFKFTVQDDGYLNFEVIFNRYAEVRDSAALSSTSKLDRKGKMMKLEICSGSGDWVVSQALNDPDSRWVALELRHDRVYNIFTKAFTSKVYNLCVIRGDARLVLEHISNKCMDVICVNFPEPPQKTGGRESEASHLLDVNFISEMIRILSVNGLCTIWTDNLWYAHLLANETSKANSKGSLQVASISPQEARRRKLDGSWKVNYVCEEIYVYEGSPGTACGYGTAASSYFDRLWAQGQMTERYFLTFRAP